MAEPLLRRTFSRLRGRDRPRPKKPGGKDREPPPPSPDSPSDPEEGEVGGGSGDFGGPGRTPGHGAYLQSLERSSRHWVLAAVKGPGALVELGDGAVGDTGATGNEGEIWYNPIPEDEDPQLPPKMLGGGEAPPKMGTEEPPQSGSGTAAGREEPGASRTPACGEMPIPCVTSGTGLSPPSPPPSPKKGRGLTKVIPGTVRRLSMKMKKLPELRRKLSLRSPRPRGHEGGTSPSETPQESTNVITRYHLDTSVASRPTAPLAKVAIKGGYLSDGDSPELPVKSSVRVELEEGENWLDVGAFHPYSCGEMPPRCGQDISGLVTVHLHGVRDLKPPRSEGREVCCVLQVDAVNRARTALLARKAAFLALNHTFNLELEGAQHLKVLIFSWDPASGRNRLCCHGTVVLPHIFRGCRAQQLAVRLQPRGVLYSKFTLVEQWETPGEREPRVFGVELGQLVEREKTPTKVPLLIQKCVAEIEKRGLKVVGLYRLCGSAAVKKELRDAFERDSAAVTLSEQLYPDINVITGILKDYLRELPTPLITPTLYHTVLEAMAKRRPRAPQGDRDAVTLLDCLPDVEKATLTRLLDHLSLVASFHAFNRMTPQNIAVCFGPVLLTQHPEPRRTPVSPPPVIVTPVVTAARGEDVAGAVDFKKHIEVLHYLLQAWPAPHSSQSPQSRDGPPPSAPQRPRGPSLGLAPVVARARPRGPESPPSNRYAGDWSVCGHQLGPEVTGGTGGTGGSGAGVSPGPGTLLVAELGLAEEAEAFGPRLNLRDFDALILDLERELGKGINVCL
ncbi:LOW QUALITY PROTEIN: rho GTPase-activating protein SYDE1 [Podargus strigoides]